LNFNSYEIVSQASQLESAVRGMDGLTSISLDTESNSRHHYPEQLCLIQIAVDHKVHLIDTIALQELTPLKKVLADSTVQKIIHGADYDIRCFDRHYGFRIRNLFDTGIAARFTGITEFGLAALIKNLLGVTITKSERLQQSDWGRRPLPAETLDYAAADVHHLFALRDILEERLLKLGRTAWVAEECARLEEVRYTEPDIANAYLAVKGSQDLNESAMAVLRSLTLFREEEARRQGRPHFLIIPDYALITLAINPKANLANITGLGPIGLQRFGRGLQEALREGQAAPPIQRQPRAYVRLTPPEATRLTRLKAWRTALGTKLALDPSLLWPAASLERLAKAPDSFEDETRSVSIRAWQRGNFVSSLKSCLLG
jgi:ribonuclease D